MEPIIERRGSEMVAVCPFCGEDVYRREAGAGDEFAGLIAFGLHAGNCRKNPNYKESDMDKLLKEIWPERFGVDGGE